MKEKTKVKVEFSIFGEDFNPDEVTKSLSIVPTCQWIKGELIKENISRNETCWEISTDYEESYDINDQLAKIISQIREKKELINTILRKTKTECKIVVVIHIENNEKPAIYLDRETINFLDQINASIDFDLYIFS